MNKLQEAAALGKIAKQKGGVKIQRASCEVITGLEWDAFLDDIRAELWKGPYSYKEMRVCQQELDGWWMSHVREKRVRMETQLAEEIGMEADPDLIASRFAAFDKEGRWKKLFPKLSLSEFKTQITRLPVFQHEKFKKVMREMNEFYQK